MIKHIVKLVAFSAVTLGLTAWIGIQILQYQTNERYQLVADFDDVTGLFPGDDVKLAGVQVGKVRSIEIHGEQARVTFMVDQAIDLPADSQVAVRWRNLIGQRYLYLYEGQSTDLLPKDGEAVVVDSRDVTDITDLVNTLGPLFTAVDPDQLNDLFDTLVQALDGNQDNVEGLVTDVNAILGVLAERESTVQGLITDYATITDELANRDQQIEAMIDNLLLLSETFADNTELVDRALVELGGFSEGLDGVLTANAGHLASILGNLSLITDTATGRLDELETTFQQLPFTLSELFETVNDGEYLNVYIPCLNLTAPPCLVPSTIPIVSDLGGQTSGAATADPAPRTTPTTAPVPLGTADALTDLLLGALGGGR